MTRLAIMNTFSVCGMLGTTAVLGVCTSAEERSKSQVGRVLVVAHRGASGYLPEHSEGAKVLAFAQGADIIEQDVVLSRDGVLVISHDVTLNATTNVRDVFPDRQRADGKYYIVDFAWSELRMLSLRERSLGNASTNARFPFATEMRMLRLEDEIKLIQGLNQLLGKQVGFHIELKSPAWHLKQFGFHMADALIEVLNEHDIPPDSSNCFIQCFEVDELRYLRDELKCRLPLVQLLGAEPLGLVKQSAQVQDRTESLKAEFAEIAKYADGIGPTIQTLVHAEASGIHSSGLVEAAHQHGLVVHPYTVRKDRLPDWCNSLDDLHHLLLNELRVDGFFTDFPDTGRKAVDQYQKGLAGH